jgi:hypothetical protein
MARLPVPGSDHGSWGDLLNEFLAVGHNSDGSLKVDPPDPDTVIAESDGEGLRIPLRDEDGVIQGYVGWSRYSGAIMLWKGDGSPELDVGAFSVYRDGSTEMNNAAWTAWITAREDGRVWLKGESIRLFGTYQDEGIDGTDTPATLSALADVLVGLGVITSHSVPAAVESVGGAWKLQVLTESEHAAIGTPDSSTVYVVTPDP